MKLQNSPFPIEEVVDGCRSGRLREMFATGTAAVISSVEKIWYNGSDLKVGNSDQHNFGEQARPGKRSKQDFVFHSPCL